jgi:hypothetical protein
LHLRALGHRQITPLRSLRPGRGRGRDDGGWFGIEDLGALVRRHRADDSIARALARVIPIDLIIIDDIGLLPVSPDGAEGFYRLVDTAYERRALAVNSNLQPQMGSMRSGLRPRQNLSRPQLLNLGAELCVYVVDVCL